LSWKKENKQTNIIEGKKYVQDENRKIMRVRIGGKIEERYKRRH